MIEKDLFREVTNRMCSTLDLTEGLKETFPLLCEQFPLDEIRLNILDTELRAVKTVAVVTKDESQDLFTNPIVLPLPNDAIAELTGDELPDIRTVDRINEDRATASIRSEFFPDVPESSMLIMRLTVDDQRLGVLLLRAEGVGRYTAGHKQLIGELNEPFSIALSNALAHREIQRLNAALREENRFLQKESRSTAEDVVGASFGLSNVMEKVHQVAPMDTTVLLLGETGVGKEVIADAIHDLSGRKNGPLVKVNCGAIPESLIDSELFGHEKGAFTGAVSEKKGRFERARGGTLFLDEIGELPPEAQLRLLRVLQTNTFERVGGSETLETDARIVAATHRDLESMVESGEFRQDLWYRINVFPIAIPPLRERRQDIPALVNRLVEKRSQEMGIYPPPALEEGAMTRLRDRNWPGNVRELENVIERELILRRNEPLQFDWLATEEIPSTKSDAEVPPAKLDTIITKHIKRALNYAEGKVGGPGGAADILGINPSTLRHRMKKLGIPYGRKST
ncbi:MAG: sigma 54-interacting transcriptional regulator [Candidatus Marinimicrobia bacterium]|nr:sigma 54-interacting transcriptional regulator [Candidatus Neomarinimicrobiota bacterium]MCF7829431.1 sigma 54-interacting transcriptional regulator [Candidatus Neomarinimicrobiota bacterium]MCF7880917.1 sigma 54-interacting transcriptional regulator [Candidatus Neomarinimicrobiota bacterium]